MIHDRPGSAFLKATTREGGPEATPQWLRRFVHLGKVLAQYPSSLNRNKMEGLMNLRLKLSGAAALMLMLPSGYGCSQETPAPPPKQEAQATVPPAAAASHVTPGLPGQPPDINLEELPVEEVIIWAEGDPDLGPPPLTVKFTVDPIDDVTNPTWEWDFGDSAAKSTEQNPTHTYNRPGAYTARVKVTDSTGNVGTDEVKIEVEVEEPEKAEGKT